MARWAGCGLLTILTAMPALCDGWDPHLAARYLDSRQKDWFAWKAAASPDGPCVSCHTGLTYLLARPALRQKLGEAEPTVWETGLLDRLKARAGEKRPGVLQGVEATFTALFLAREDAGRATLRESTRRAFDQLWALRTSDGGARAWYSAQLDPWETPEAFDWGGALAALAAGTAPASYLSEPAVRGNVKELASSLQDGFETKPLHHRLGV
ncbi:MAG: hypothetical protein ABUS49_10735, partial [Acidobacteriota bacterium]